MGSSSFRPLHGTPRRHFLHRYTRFVTCWFHHSQGTRNNALDGHTATPVYVGGRCTPHSRCSAIWYWIATALLHSTNIRTHIEYDDDYTEQVNVPTKKQSSHPTASLGDTDHKLFYNFITRPPLVNNQIFSVLAKCACKTRTTHGRTFSVVPLGSPARPSGKIYSTASGGLSSTPWTPAC